MKQKKPAGVDYEALAAGIGDLREALRAMTAGLQADGYTEEQARTIVAGVFSTMGKRGDDE